MINLRPRARDPYRVAAPIAGRKFRVGNGWKFCPLPAHEAALEYLCGNSAVAQPCGYAFTIESLFANHDDRASGKRLRPFLRIEM